MASGKAVILVVEDNAVIRMGAMEMVANAGFEAVEAGSAEEAIHILESRPDVHLVFTDVEIPGSMDGLKLAHYISNRWPPVRLIVASGKMLVQDSHLPAGARFFPKPYSACLSSKRFMGCLWTRMDGGRARSRRPPPRIAPWPGPPSEGSDFA